MDERASRPLVSEFLVVAMMHAGAGEFYDRQLPLRINSSHSAEIRLSNFRARKHRRGDFHFISEAFDNGPDKFRRSVLGPVSLVRHVNGHVRMLQPKSGHRIPLIGIVQRTLAQNTPERFAVAGRAFAKDARRRRHFLRVNRRFVRSDNEEHRRARRRRRTTQPFDRPHLPFKRFAIDTRRRQRLRNENPAVQPFHDLPTRNISEDFLRETRIRDHCGLPQRVAISERIVEAFVKGRI